MVLKEGRLRIGLPPNTTGWKLDDEYHGLSHAMKAVDFIVKYDDKVWFIEIKDPDHSKVPQKARKKFLNKLKSAALDQDLVRKYRDSWLYLWACEKVGGSFESHYYIIIASDNLDRVLLERRTAALRRLLPLDNPRGRWRRKFVVNCEVFNIELWNQRFVDFPITTQHTS